MIDLNYLCTVIGNLAVIPIRVYEGERQVFYHSLVNLPKDPALIYLNKLLSTTKNVEYLVTPHFNYYGIVKSSETRIVIGPTRQLSADEQTYRQIAFENDVPAYLTDDFISAMKSIMPMPLESIMQILFTMNHVLNGDKLSLEDIAISSTEQENISKAAAEPIDYSDFENVDFGNNSYDLEQNLMSIVRHGDTSTLREWLKNAPAVRSGILAGEQLRQAKNTFICTATLVSRNAIRGGMDVKDAFKLSDSYIQRCELLSSQIDITNLQYHMVLDYTERVERLRLGKEPSKLAIEVTNYVLHHLSDPIKTEDIAAALFISRSRLSTKFKQETGTNLTDYILKEKAIEAKRLLRYSNKSITAIAEYLGFSSPAHFARTFKKYIGLTPNEYREKKS